MSRLPKNSRTASTTCGSSGKSKMEDVETSTPPSLEFSTSIRDDDDDESSSGGGGNKGGGEGKDSKANNNDKKEKPLVQSETTAVNRSKLLVYLVLAVAAAVVCTLTFVLTRNDEQKTFHAEFTAYAKETIDVSVNNAANFFGGLESLGTSVTSFAKTTNATMPYFGFPDFERRTETIRRLSRAELIAFAPFVKQGDIEGWETYSAQHQGWIREGLDVLGLAHVDPGEIPSTIYDYQDPDAQDDHGHHHDQDHGHHHFRSRSLGGGHDDHGHGGHGGHDEHGHGHDDTAEEHQRTQEMVKNSAFPVWQMSPPPRNATIVNMNLLPHPSFASLILHALEEKRPLLSEIIPLEFLYKYSLHDDENDNTSNYDGNQGDESTPGSNDHSNHHDDHATDHHGHGHHRSRRRRMLTGGGGDETPHSFILQPVFDRFDDVVVDRETPESSSSSSGGSKNITGVLIGVLPWDRYFSGIVHEEDPGGLVVELSDSCGSLYSFLLEASSVKVLGEGSLHDAEYDSLHIHRELELLPDWAGKLDHSHCDYSLEIYPTDELRSSYRTRKPAVYTGIVFMVFFFTALVFFAYDYLVARRQVKVMATAERTNAIVVSLFPSAVRQRMMEEAEQKLREEEEEKKNNKRQRLMGTSKNQLKKFLGDVGAGAGPHHDQQHDASAFEGRPIADLFPHVSILFADLVGFTAWSSTREPTQVFSLLETLYGSFDEIARRHSVYKVETVGDCYVAACGLPDPRKDHAVVICKFAAEILEKLNAVTTTLEVQLGPDTGDLGLRVGVHSGQVTAGVLRGDRQRFQLFGDTMNTASRMESTSLANKIQVSRETADLLTAAGKGHWIRPREELVNAKGKGMLQTFWLYRKGATTSRSSHSGATDTSSSMAAQQDLVAVSIMEANEKKRQRLVEWNTALLSELLRAIVARRTAAAAARRGDGGAAAGSRDAEERFSSREITMMQRREGTTLLDEVKEIIPLPSFDQAAAAAVSSHGTGKDNNKNSERVVLGDSVRDQLRDYVHTISAMYNANPFHNFEHASHVTMSAQKLLSRIVAPELDELGEDDDDDDDMEKHKHDFTYGITSDPLTQFSVVLSALLHDVDHPGVPNSVLVKEKTSLAIAYNNTSCAEQNSIDLAFELLFEDGYEDLRGAIYATKEEFQRFRSLVVNAVMATDIMDKELGALRKARWDAAFAEHGPVREDSGTTLNRKATIVIEHLIQASDVAHTMQHWHIYRKWNQRLFEEMYKAYINGRVNKDPSLNWYEGEIGFFQFYVIPLAKKLRDCGVFGVSCDEYLMYAEQNFQEWKLKGKELVEMMKEKCQGIDCNVDDKISLAQMPKATSFRRLAPDDVPKVQEAMDARSDASLTC